MTGHPTRRPGRHPVFWGAIAATAGAFIGVVPARADTVLVPAARFVAPSSPPAGGFGRSVAGLGSPSFGSEASLAVGAPLAQRDGASDAVGRVYVFDAPDAGEPKILDSDSPEGGGRFGAALAGATEGFPRTMVVGAPGQRDGGFVGAGALYLFELSGMVQKRMRISNPRPVAGGALGTAVAQQDLAFGSSVIIVAGAPALGQPGEPGAAFLYVITPGVGNFTIIGELVRSAPSAGSLFGAAVALSRDGQKIFVGSPFEGDPGHRTGAVYVFPIDVLLNHSPGVPIENPTVLQGEIVKEDGFGGALATGTDFLVVGAPLAEVAGIAGAGMVHIFDPTGTLLKTIPNPSPTVDAGFGAAVTVAGDRIFVGAPFDDAAALDGGAVYQFDGDRESASFGMPLSPATLRLPAPTSFGNTGASLAPILTAGDLAVGAPARDRIGEGTAIVYDRCGDGVRFWEQCDLGTSNGGECSEVCVLGPIDCGSVEPLVSEAVSIADEDCPPPGDPVFICNCSQTVGCGCDDGIYCTDPDICAGRGDECRGQPNNLRCNDGNACTEDRCDATLDCVHDPIVCPADTDGDDCTVGSCDPATGNCTTLRAEGCGCSADRECDDGDPCNGTLLCERNECYGCDIFGAALSCCSKKRTCELEFPAPAAGSGCDDGNRCTRNDECIGDPGRCAGTVDICDDGEACTLDTCDPILGCRHSPQPDGYSCSDGDRCTGDEVCRAGACTDAPDVPDCLSSGCSSCDDGNECTIEGCDNGACTHVALAGLDGVRCLFREPPPAECANDGLDDIAARLEQAQARMDEAAETAKRRRQRALVHAGLERLARAKKLVVREGRKNTIGAACRDALKGRIRRVVKAARAFLKAS